MTQPQKAPLISFCIPTYNRADCLRAALSSILCQAASDVEVVVSDNGSNDGTCEMVRELQEKYPQLRYFRSETNLGYDRNVLRCVEMAAGEYVWLFGSDDQLKAGAVVAVCRELREQPAMAFVNFEVVTEQGEILSRGAGWSKEVRFRSPRAFLAFMGTNFGFMTTLVLRRQLCLATPDLAQGVGTGLIHLYMVLWALARGRSFVFVGHRYVRKRNPSLEEYDLLPVLGSTNRILWNARRYGHSGCFLYLLIGRILVPGVMKFVAGQRACSRFTRELVPPLVRAYWMFPHFWVLVFPLCFLPQGLMVVLRGAFRRVRAWVLGGEQAAPAQRGLGKIAKIAKTE